MEEQRIKNSAKPAKKPSVVSLTPADCLTFDVSSNSGSAVTSKLVIVNPTEDVICFKVKTTAPKEYCVRPNSGKLEPKGQTEISVMLQPPLPKPDMKSRDKFLVQTVLESAVADPSATEMWKTVKKDEIMEDKLKCTWKFTAEPEAATPAAQQTPKPDGDDEAPHAAVPSRSSVPAQAKPAAPAPTSKLSNNVTSASDKPAPVKTTKTEVQPAQPAKAATQTEVPSLLLLLGVFVLGYIFGKFVL